MSLKNCSNNTTASEHQEGVSLPGGRGIGNGKATDLNLSVLDKIFAAGGVDDSNHELLSDVDRPVDRPVDESPDEVDIKEILEKYVGNSADLDAVAASVLLCQDIRLVPVYRKGKGRVKHPSSHEFCKRGFYDGFQWSSALGSTPAQRCIACGERWRDMVIHGFKSGLIESSIISELMFSCTQGNQTSVFDVFLLKETGTVISADKRGRDQLCAKVKVLYDRIIQILNNHEQFCTSEMGFHIYRRYVRCYIKMLQMYSSNVKQITVDSDSKEVHKQILKLVCIGEHFHCILQSDNLALSSVKEIINIHKVDKSNPSRYVPVFLSIALDILKKVCPSFQFSGNINVEGADMKSLAQDVITHLATKETNDVGKGDKRRSKRIQKRMEAQKQASLGSSPSIQEPSGSVASARDGITDSSDSDDEDENEEEDEEEEKGSTCLSSRRYRKRKKKDGVCGSLGIVTPERPKKRKKTSHKKMKANRQSRSFRIGTFRQRRRNKKTICQQKYRQNSSRYISHQAALLKRKDAESAAKEKALKEAKASIEGGSCSVREIFDRKYLVSDDDIEKLSLTTVWEKWVNEDGKIVKGPDEDKYGVKCLTSIPRDKYSTEGRDIRMAELGYCPAGKLYVYGLDHLHVNSHCVVPWEITEQLVKPILLPSTTSPITKLVTMGPGGQFSRIGDRQEAGAVLYDSEKDHKLYTEIFDDVEFNYREVTELILQYNKDNPPKKKSSSGKGKNPPEKKTPQGRGKKGKKTSPKKKESNKEKETHLDETRGHIGFDGGFNVKNYHEAKDTQADDPDAVGAKPNLIRDTKETIPLYIAAGDLLHRCSIFSRKLMKKKGDPVPLSDRFRRSLFADILKEKTCAPGFVDFEAFTWALLRLGKTDFDENGKRRTKWFKVNTDSTTYDKEGVDENGDPVIMVGKLHVDGPNDGREPGTVVFSITFHHSDGYVYRLSLICYTRKCCGDYLTTETSVYEPMYLCTKQYFEDRNGGMHFYEMSLHDTMVKPSHKVKAFNLDSDGKSLPNVCAGAEWQIASFVGNKSNHDQPAEPIVFENLPYFSSAKGWYKDSTQEKLAERLAKKHSAFAKFTPVEINKLKVEEANATAAYLTKSFYTGTTSQTESSKDDPFSLWCFTVRELMNRNAYMSAYASTICHFCMKYNLSRNVKEELVLCAAACPSPVTFRAVFHAWESKSKRLVHYLQCKGITLSKLLSDSDDNREEGDIIMAFLHTCQCFLCLPTTGPYARQQSSHSFPGRSNEKEVDQDQFPWLSIAGLYITESREKIMEDIEKVRNCVRALHIGEFYNIPSTDLPQGIRGPVSSTNLKTLIVLTGLHLPDPTVNDGRPDYDDKESWAIQEAKWAEVNHDSNYASKFLNDCTPKGLKNWFDQHETKERHVTGNWCRAFKACTERFFADMKEKERQEGICIDEDHLRDDLLDREGDIENPLCAIYRNTPRSDVFFYGQDLFNITGCDVLVKMWETDEWIPLRQYFDQLETMYSTHINTAQYKRAKNAGRR